MYLDLMESLVLWFELRGSARKDALLRAGVAFAGFGLAALISVAVFLTVLGGVPVAGWVIAHSWSIWTVAVVLALIHWCIALKLRSRSHGGTRTLGSSKPSPHLCWWYFLPVLASLIVAAVVAIANSTS